jgi:hypothetical protein
MPWRAPTASPRPQFEEFLRLGRDTGARRFSGVREYPYYAMFAGEIGRRVRNEDAEKNRSCCEMDVTIVSLLSEENLDP